MAPSLVPVARPIVLTDAERTTLERWARGRRVPRRLVRRARIVLQAAAGLTNAAIARALHTDRECVGRWRGRFATQRLAGLQREAPGRGRPPVIPDPVLAALVTPLTATVAPAGRPWSTRALAREAGVSPATIHRICQATGLTPHWGRAVRLQTPFPGFSRLTSVLGGYLTELDSALVVGGDVVGPERPAPAPPPRRPGDRPPSVPARYAVPLPPLARVVAGTPAQNRGYDWLQFLKYVAARIPRGYWVHVFADNLLTHQHPAIPAWLAAHPQVVLHLLPTGTTLPRWFLPRLQRWGGERMSPDRQAQLRSLRAAVTALRPRSVRKQRPAFWMTRNTRLVRAWCGDPRWRLPLDPVAWRPQPGPGKTPPVG